MGLGGISWPQLLIVLVIVLALFGTKRLKNIGSDLGGAIKGFKKSMKDGDDEAQKLEQDDTEKAEGTLSDDALKQESLNTEDSEKTKSK